MKHANPKQDQENFNDDPGQNIRIENEILKLKMQAERGAFFSEGSEDLPPEIEAEFLKNVQLFEDSFDKAKPVTIYECIGRPAYKRIEELNPGDVRTEIEKIMELLHSKNILLEVLGRYDLSVIYEFIIEELFYEEIKEVDFPGYMHRFIYEQFHPNHSIDIGNTAQRFLNHWFEKGFDQNSTEFNGQLITAEGRVFSKEEVIKKLCYCLNSYQSFTNIRFKGPLTSFEWNDAQATGMGHAEGVFSYDAEVESGEIIHIEGPFKLYMSNENGTWNIFYFVFPGFAWEE
jgi:hypothetical protein